MFSYVDPPYRTMVVVVVVEVVVEVAIVEVVVVVEVVLVVEVRCWGRGSCHSVGKG